MRFRFIWIGKTRNKHWRGLQDEYLGRLEHFVKCSVVEIKESAPHEGPEAEAKKFLKLLPKDSFVVLLDVKGRSISSHQLSAEVAKWQEGAIKELIFLIGGAEGVTSEVAERANDRLSLSFLTFTHDMSRVLLFEQLYRAFSILKGFPYQK
ncbi:23S rRNA (pseudouridine(1915)-N(3))-methyltransferase RlmH [soil metagenome]